MEAAVRIRVMQQWRCEPLLIPTSYKFRKETVRTTWTEAGAELIKAQRYKNGGVAARLGTHYTAISSAIEEYILSPKELGTVSHSWVLVRRKRPAAVVVEGLTLPSGRRTGTYNAQYFSIFPVLGH